MCALIMESASRKRHLGMVSQPKPDYQISCTSYRAKPSGINLLVLLLYQFIWYLLTNNNLKGPIAYLPKANKKEEGPIAFFSFVVVVIILVWYKYHPFIMCFPTN